MESTVILPAHNEEGYIEDAVERILEKEFVGEIIIVEDGCTDRTPEISRELDSQEPKVRHIHSDKKLGKGKAIERGITASKNDRICFMDLDLATDLSDLKSLLKGLENHDLVIGSRYQKESEAERSKKRLIPSKIYNFLASKTLGTGIPDHQCGFKAIDKQSFEDMTDINSNSWFWDTEMLYRARKNSLKIKELAVDWKEDKNSEVNILTASKEMSRGLYRLNKEKRPRLIKYLKFAAVGAFGAALNTALLFGLTEYFNLYYMLSSAIAIETAIVTMFFINNHLTFEKTKAGLRKTISGIIRSNMVRSIGITINMGLLYVLTQAGLFYIFSNIIAIFAASIVNFYGEKNFNWKE